MKTDSAMSVLKVLAGHNEWANGLIFAACSEIDTARLKEVGDGYDSVIGILKHLVQVEYSFFELAHGRAPQRIELEELAVVACGMRSHRPCVRALRRCAGPDRR